MCNENRYYNLQTNKYQGKNLVWFAFIYNIWLNCVNLCHRIKMQIHALHNKTRNHILKSKVKCLYLFLDLDQFYGDVITILNNSRNIITSCLVKMALFLLQHHRYGNRHSDGRSLTSCHCKQINNKNNWWLGYEWIAEKTNHVFI